MWYLLITSLLIYLNLYTSRAVENNVCKTFEDYLHPIHNKNCYFNPDAYLDGPEIIKRHGYPFVIHNVTTEDGYILSLFRIQHGKDKAGDAIRPPVFLQHGLLSSSPSFYFRGNTSLAFILADNGYDVWLGNFRGVRYSDKHKFLNKSSREYWNFSFHELGIYDLPAQLNLVANLTGQKVMYIGISMGCTAFYVYSSEFPDAAFDRIKLAISLAPVAFLEDLQTTIRIFSPLWPIIENMLYSFTNGSTIIRRDFTAMLQLLCLPLPIKMRLCLRILALFYGEDQEQADPEYVPIIFSQLFDESALKVTTHYLQLFQSGGFKQFDYGKNNMKIYGTMNPPDYQLSHIKVPNYIIRGKNDVFATKKNVELLYSALPPRAKLFDIYIVKYDKFSHADFVLARDVKSLLYDHIVNILGKQTV